MLFQWICRESHPSQNICRYIWCISPEHLFSSRCHTLPILRRSQSKQTDAAVFPACVVVSRLHRESRSACGRRSEQKAINSAPHLRNGGARGSGGSPHVLLPHRAGQRSTVINTNRIYIIKSCCHIYQRLQSVSGRFFNYRWLWRVIIFCPRWQVVLCVLLLVISHFLHLSSVAIRLLTALCCQKHTRSHVTSVR